MNPETIKAFVTLGLTEKESKVLSLLMDNKSVASRDFERTLDMRQPEVSTALKNLQSRGWVRNGDKIKSSGMTRSGNTYEFCYVIDNIIDELRIENDKKQLQIIEARKQLLKR